MENCSLKRLFCGTHCFTISVCEAVSQPNLMTVQREGVPLTQEIRTIRTFDCKKRCY